jgi:phage I-like protein
MPMATNAQHLVTLADGRQLVRLACAIAQVEADGAHWVQVLPMGPNVEARDGRSFRVSDAAAIVASSALPMLVDWDHKSEMGLFSDSGAAGWVEELAVEDGTKKRFPDAGIWGRVDWTDEGASDVSKKKFRYVSPVVMVSKDGEARLLDGLALTNRPALSMQAIDAHRERMSARFGELRTGAHDQGESMKPETVRLLLAALALADGANDEAIISAVKSAQASRELCSKLTTDLAAANTELQTLRTRLVETDRQAFTREVTEALDAGAKEGRITPAQKTQYQEFCIKSRENFELFTKTILPTLPKLAEAAPPSNTPAPAPENGGGALSEDERANLIRQGFTKEEVAAAEAEQARLMNKRVKR